MTDECLFCRIVSGAIPSTAVASSDLSFAFRDLNPQAPTHVLVVPRAHIATADDVRGDHAADVADLFVTAQDVARREGLMPDGYRLVFNVGEISGNTVPHLHLHVLGGRRL